ncbi:Flp family type IVb pilin [Burkholderia sp. LMG 21824]|uniref:Flp family type IVb pilin n=1 Tax=Burkholderia sp. LMG 21824 TaxID=3158172 RepID=UPI003C2F835E
MQTRARIASLGIGDEQGMASIEYAFLAATLAVAVLGIAITLKGSLADTSVVIATAVLAAAATALAMVS